MKTHIDQLTNEQLAVLAALGQGWRNKDGWLLKEANTYAGAIEAATYDPCNNWNQAGELVEKFNIWLYGRASKYSDWSAEILDDGNKVYQSAATPKLAIVKAFVASKYGVEIDFEKIAGDMK